MSFSITETDVWPRLRGVIEYERAARLDGLRRVATMDEMKWQQGFLEGLEWVLAEAAPKPQRREED